MKKRKLKSIYIHTIRNCAACFYPDSGQICFTSQNNRNDNIPATSLLQIRKEQRITFKYRESRGYECDRSEYGYRRYSI